jgi:hypothetical protein
LWIFDFRFGRADFRSRFPIRAERQPQIANRKSQWGLALPLLVARILANDAQDILALHDAAGLAKPFD